MRPVLERWIALWGELEMKRRVQLVAVTVITLGVLIGVAVWSATPPWRPLLEGRDYGELLDAAASLEQAGVKYRIKDGALQVPAGQLGAGQAAVATMQDHPSAKDAEAVPMGTTPSMQGWAVVRTLQGDLARTINTIDGIAASWVNIVPETDSLFLDESQPAQASVFLKLRPGRSIGDSQVRSIASLVANAVKGLTPDRVAVIDDHGTLLAEGLGPRGSATDLASEMLEHRKALELHYEGTVVQALQPVMGFEPGGFSVTATVDLDMSSTEKKSMTVDPKSPALVSERLDESNKESEAAGGVPGADANVPERPNRTNGGTTKEEKSIIDSQYEPSRAEEVATRPAGEIKRVSVAVQVDSARVAKLAEMAGVEPATIQKQIDQVVKGAVGMDPARSDQVSVTFIPFSPSPLVEESLGTITATVLAHDSMPYLLVALALILAFVFVVRPLVTSVTRPVPTPGAEGEIEGDLSDEEQDELLAQRLQQLVENFVPVDAMELSELVSHNPQAAAKVLKQWQKYG